MQFKKFTTRLRGSMSYFYIRSISESGRPKMFRTLFAASCRNSRSYKYLFSTFFFENHLICECNKIVSKSESLSLDKSAKRQ